MVNKRTKKGEWDVDGLRSCHEGQKRKTMGREVKKQELRPRPQQDMPLSTKLVESFLMLEPIMTLIEPSLYSSTVYH